MGYTYHRDHMHIHDRTPSINHIDIRGLADKHATQSQHSFAEFIATFNVTDDITHTHAKPERKISAPHKTDTQRLHHHKNTSQTTPIKHDASHHVADDSKESKTHTTRNYPYRMPSPLDLTEQIYPEIYSFESNIPIDTSYQEYQDMPMFSDHRVNALSTHPFVRTSPIHIDYDHSDYLPLNISFHDDDITDGIKQNVAWPIVSDVFESHSNGTDHNSIYAAEHDHIDTEISTSAPQIAAQIIAPSLFLHSMAQTQSLDYTMPGTEDTILPQSLLDTHEASLSPSWIPEYDVTQHITPHNHPLPRLDHMAREQQIHVILKSIQDALPIHVGQVHITAAAPMHTAPLLATPMLFSLYDLNTTGHLGLDYDRDDLNTSTDITSFTDLSAIQKNKLNERQSHNTGDSGGSSAQSHNKAEHASSIHDAHMKSSAFQNVLNTFRMRLHETHMRQSPHTYINIHVSHEQLGTLDVRLSTANNKISAKFFGETKAMQKQLALHRREIEEILENSGFELDQNPVLIYQKED